jgi:adenylate cyclase
MNGRAPRYDVVVTVALFLLAVLAQRFEWFAVLEDHTLSFRHQLRMAFGDATKLSPAPEVVLVNTDEPFFQAYKSFPLRRTDIGAIVTNLKSLGAKVIAVDMLMDFPSSYGEDPALAKALVDAGNVILVSQAEFRAGKFVKINRPTALLDQSADCGYTNIESNSNLVTMLSRLTVHPNSTGERGGWPFAVKAAALFLGVEPKLEGTTLVLGERRVPLDHEYRLSVDFPPLPTGTRFLSQSAGLTALEFLDISSLDESERAELEYWVKDKIVLVGDTSEVSHDRFNTPVGIVYGVEIVADSIGSILRESPLRAAGMFIDALPSLILMTSMVLLSLFLARPLPRALSVAALGSGFILLASWLYVSRGLLLSMTYALLALGLSYLVVEFRQYLIDRSQKQQIAKTFGQYIPPELVSEMTRSGQTVTVGGESRQMTVLFSDVRGFTTISEGLTPQSLTVLMNSFLSPMTHVIHDHRGTIDKYMGDAIMAFWGAPLPDSDHARRAVQAALGMVEKMDSLKDDFLARGWKPIRVGVGLNTGIMNVGNMGSDFRMAYTVMGDAVNLGSRVEGLTKQYGVNLMVTEYTQAAVPGLVSREIDLVRVKGKDTPVRLYEPVGFEGEVDSETAASLTQHLAALALFRKQQWDAAQAAFEALAAADPERVIYRIYLDRIAHFRDEPPDADWDGVYTHKDKG